MLTAVAHVEHWGVRTTNDERGRTHKERPPSKWWIASAEWTERGPWQDDLALAMVDEIRRVKEARQPVPDPRTGEQLQEEWRQQRRKTAAAAAAVVREFAERDGAAAPAGAGEGR